MEDVVSSGWWVQLLGVAITLIMGILAYVAKRFTSWLIRKAELNESEKEAMQYLLEGMAKAQDEIVREAKQASEDGKLTKAEIKQAETIAYNYAKEAATGKAKDIIVSWTSRRASSLIKQLLAKLKNKKGTNNGNTVSPDTKSAETNS